SRQHHATSTITLRQPPDSVWKVVRDIAGGPSWWPAIKRVERLPDRDGREVWRQKMSGFDVPIIVLESKPPRRLVTQIDPKARAAGRQVLDFVHCLQGDAVLEVLHVERRDFSRQR